MDDKTYTAEVIDSNPFPNQEAVVPTQTSTLPKDTYQATVIKTPTMPTRKIANELIGSALNTRSRKILAEFEFTRSGSLQIGAYTEGLSGDIRISPNGIVARNSSGITTFAIDGTTGDAIFLGTIQAGTIISEGIIQGGTIIGGIINGTVIEGGEININNNFTVNGDGDVVIGNSNLDLSNPSLKFYNNEGSLVGELNGDVGVNRFIRWEECAFGGTVFYESATNLTGEIARINVDDGLMMFADKHITLAHGGVGGANAPSANSVVLYTDTSGGKDRLMARFNTGVAQQIAIEP